jgi:small conductance mechanosensitive channel
MVLEEFSVDRSNPSSSGNCGLAFGFGGQYLIRDIISGLLLFLKINTGDVGNFTRRGKLKRSV